MKRCLFLSLSALSMVSIPAFLPGCATYKPTQLVAESPKKPPAAKAAKPRARKSKKPPAGGASNEKETAGPKVPGINSFAENYNQDGTITYTWISPAVSGDWFRIEDELPDGTTKVLYSTTYGSSKLPYVPGCTSYSITLDPATDYLP